MTALLRITAALAIVCLGVSFGARANAEDTDRNATQNPNGHEAGLQVGAGVICNSSDQVKRYLALKTDDSSIEDAIKVVNVEANDARACGMAMVAFVTGDEAGDVNVSHGTMHVRRITIVAVATDGGWQRVPDTVQYTAFFEKLESV